MTSGQHGARSDPEDLSQDPAGGGGSGMRASEREKTKMRERQRRAITTRIFAGLRKHGGYNLPPRADINDVLRELAREAGWAVEPDGTTYRQQPARGGASRRHLPAPGTYAAASTGQSPQPAAFQAPAGHMGGASLASLQQQLPLMVPPPPPFLGNGAEASGGGSNNSSSGSSGACVGVCSLQASALETRVQSGARSPPQVAGGHLNDHGASLHAARISLQAAAASHPVLFSQVAAHVSPSGAGAGGAAASAQLAAQQGSPFGEWRDQSLAPLGGPGAAAPGGGANGHYGAVHWAVGGSSGPGPGTVRGGPSKVVVMEPEVAARAAPAAPTPPAECQLVPPAGASAWHVRAPPLVRTGESVLQPAGGGPPGAPAGKKARAKAG